jgi:hypothetical protein
MTGQDAARDADPDVDDPLAPPPPLLSAAFWAALAAGLLLVVAGAVVGFLGTRLFPPGAAKPAAHGRVIAHTGKSAL